MLKEMEIEKSRSTIVRQLSNAGRVDPTSDLELTPPDSSPTMAEQSLRNVASISSDFGFRSMGWAPRCC